MPRSLPLAFCAMLAAGAAVGAERSHVVAPGESASAIARHYYGDFSFTERLLAFNDRTGSVLHPGETLRIPYNEVHRVEPGDSWSRIAHRYLGRPSAWRALAALNGSEGQATLRVGQQVVIPVVLERRLRRGENLARLAERFYGDPARADLLAEFNEIEKPRHLAVGRELGIPLVGFRLAKPPPPPAAAVTAAPPPPEVEADDAAVASALSEAAEAWRRGEYVRARSLLEAVDVAPGSRAQRARYWRMLAFVYVAFDASERACRAWSELSPQESAASLDPDLVSPKIRETLAGCPS